MGPGVYAAAHIDCILKAACLEVLHHIQATHAMVAEYDHFIILGQCFDSLWYLAHRYVQGSLDSANRQLNVFSHIQKNHIFGIFP